MKKILEAYNVKITKTRLIVTELIADEGDNTFTVADIASGLDENPIQTVYGILKSFMIAGIIEQVPTLDNGKAFKATLSFQKDIQIYTEYETVG